MKRIRDIEDHVCWSVFVGVTEYHRKVIYNDQNFFLRFGIPRRSRPLVLSRKVSFGTLWCGRRLKYKEFKKKKRKDMEDQSQLKIRFPLLWSLACAHNSINQFLTWPMLPTLVQLLWYATLENYVINTSNLKTHSETVHCS